METQTEVEQPQEAKSRPSAGSELSAQNTRLAFHRTRLGADRTLMAIMRTSLSLIAFGFTSFQFLHHLPGLSGHQRAGRALGLALVFLGVTLQSLGIWSHLRFMRVLREERSELIARSLLRDTRRFPYSIVLIMAVLLLGVGVATIFGLVIETAWVP